MKKRSSIVLVCVIVIVIALAGIVGLNSLKENKIKESESNNKKVTTTEVITKNTDKDGLSNDTKNDSSDDVLNDNSNNSNSTDVDSNSDDDWSDLY